MSGYFISYEYSDSDGLYGDSTEPTQHLDRVLRQVRLLVESPRVRMALVHYDGKITHAYFREDLGSCFLNERLRAGADGARVLVNG